MNNKKKRSKLIAALVGILIILVVVAIMIAKNGKDGDSTETDLNSEVEQVMESGIKVETIYGDFFISDEWFDYFEYEIKDKKDYKVVFNAAYEECKSELFTLVFAEEAEGTLLGSLKVDGKTVNVYMQLDEIEIPKDLPIEKHDAFYGMQEEVNSIITQLNQMKGFTPAE